MLDEVFDFFIGGAVFRKYCLNQGMLVTGTNTDLAIKDHRYPITETSLRLMGLNEFVEG